MSHTEKRDCDLELDGNSLKKIAVGPKVLDFGEIFKNSEQLRTFWIKNNLKSSIFIKIENNNPELKRRYLILKSSKYFSKVIYPSHTEGFNLIFFSNEIRPFSKNLKYSINNKYSFNLPMTANIVAVSLKYDPLNKFLFKNEKVQDNRVEMTVSQTLVLRNDGNATANFSWEEPKNMKLWNISPLKGSVEKLKTSNVIITFTPLEGIFKGDQKEELKCNIEYGSPIIFEVVGNVPEARCSLPSEELNFGNVHVGVEESREFIIRNDFKNKTAYKIDDSQLKEFLSFKEASGYIDSKKTVTAVIKSQSPIPNFNEKVNIYIRGGIKLVLSIKANIMIPNVYIVQESFDFGDVTIGGEVVKTLTIKNESKIAAKVIINLNTHPDLKSFKIHIHSKYNGKNSHLITNLDKEEKVENNTSVDSEDEEESEDEDEDVKDIRNFQVDILANSELDFEYIFKPDATQTSDKYFNFIPDFELKGVKNIPGLQRKVIAKVVKPKIFLTKEKVIFPKTFIYGGTHDKNFNFEDIKLSNDTDSDIKWMIDTRDIDQENVFEVKDKSGLLLPAKGNPICHVKIKFQPEKKKKYEAYIYLNIYDEKLQKYVPYKSILLQGEGTHPRVYFDRRQIILPIVPLNIESRLQFKIKNDGYESARLSHRFISEMGNIPVTLDWLDDKTIGILKSELRLELAFKSNKPISFTCKLVLFDESNNEFPVYVCGTSDNCLFTNYSFLQRNFNNYEIIDDENNLNVVIRDGENMNGHDDNDRQSISISHLSSVITKNSVLSGLPKINKKIQLNNCKYLKRFCNLVCNSANIKNFPEDLMKENGELIFELIYILTGKIPPRIPKSEMENKDNIVKNLRKQYEELIRNLQTEGAFLNTIYPEYLLDWPQYFKYINYDDAANSFKLLAPDWQNKKGSMKKTWNYYNKESWILLVYQILKLYYLSRVNIKAFRATLRVLPESENQKYSGNIKFPVSNIYSTNELILMKWMQILFDYSKISSNPIKLKNFADDFSDGNVLASIILTYFPKIEEKYKLPKKKVNSDGKIGGLNIEKFLYELKSYGIYTHIKAKHFSIPNPKEIMLFIVMLFQNLVHFIPKDTITFTCILGETVTKVITIENSNPNRRIEYFIKKEGSDDYVIPNIPEIKLENAPFELPVQFKSKVSMPVEGKLYLINKNEGFNYQAAPLVFNLTSKITGRKSIMPILAVTSQMYKEKKFKLTVRSPIKERAEFDIKIQIVKKLPVIKTKAGRFIKPINVQKKKDDEILYKVFYTESEYERDSKYSERFEFDKPKDINLYFSPIDLETYECYVIFTNEKYGEFQYTIEGKGELPECMKVVNQTCSVDDHIEIALEIDPINRLLTEALSNLKTENKLVENKVPKKKMNFAVNEKLNFTVESSKSFFNVPNTFNMIIEKENAIKDKATDSKNSKDASQISSMNKENKNNLLVVKFSSKLCQFFEGDIILRNIENITDIRIYKVRVTVVPKNIKAVLEFTCPLYEKIVQKIPILNNSDKEWTVKAEITQDGPGFFSGPNEKRIPKKTQGDFYPLTFYPKEKTNDVTGRLILNNLATQELYEYKIIGRIDDPLAEGSLEIVCNAKESVKKTIVIKNSTENDKLYVVETDMADIVSGLPSFNVRAGESYSYDITVRPILGKVYFGKITFIDQKKNTIWYTIKIEAKSQFNNIDSPIEMRTSIRKAIFLKFLLENPTKETVFFKIDYEGEYLFGEKEFKLDGNKSADYELYYAPLKVGKKEGTIHIYNENIGEFLYKLSLICEENTPIYPDVMKSELGRFVELPVILDNPLDEEIELFYKNTNIINFSIIPDKISLPPYSKYKILIRYTPSSIDFEEETTIVFENSKVGKWEYHIRGKGVPPTEMEKTIVSTYVGGITSGMINFKNPFKDYLNVSLELKSNSDINHTFKLMLKKEKYSIQPFRVLQIPFSFSPENLTKYFAEIYVYVANSKSIFWKFPIEGITEVKSKEVDFVFKTKAKKLYDKEIPLDLTSLPNDITNEVFSLSLSIKEEKYKGLIEKCLSIELLRNFLIEGSNKLPIRVKFYPLRPFKTECELIISKSHGGNWIFNAILESNDPDPDDIIHIQSSLGKKSSVSFKLHNVFTKHAKFVAYFSHDSTAEFSVEPREGFLDQSGKDGTMFIVSYVPEEYGKVKVGKLIIETDEIQWVFEVRGGHMDYKPPEIKSTNIHKMTRTMMNRFNDKEKFESVRNKVKQMDKRSRSKSKSKSRSRSKGK